MNSRHRTSDAAIALLQTSRSGINFRILQIFCETSSHRGWPTNFGGGYSNSDYFLQVIARAAAPSLRRTGYNARVSPTLGGRSRAMRRGRNRGEYREAAGVAAQVLMRGRFLCFPVCRQFAQQAFSYPNRIKSGDVGRRLLTVSSFYRQGSILNYI